MTQSVKDQDKGEQRRGRPGQRQQERLLRQARRRRRSQQLTVAIIALVLIVLGIFGVLGYQNYTAAQTKLANNHATATAGTHATATAVANNAQATAMTANCATGFTTTTPVSGSSTPTAGPVQPPRTEGNVVKLKDGLQYIDIKTGTGAAAKEGSDLMVEYTGWLQNGCKKFDSSYDHQGQTLEVKPLGKAGVIDGWNEGLVGMRAGGTRRLIIPSALGYGAQGYSGVIPPNAPLIFDVTVVTVK